MAKKKPTGSTLDKQMARIGKAATPEKERDGRAYFWETLIPLLIPLLENLFKSWADGCPEQNQKRLARIIGRVSRIGQIRYVNELQDAAEFEHPNMRFRRRDCRALIRAGVSDVKKNPKDTVKSLLELRGE